MSSDFRKVVLIAAALGLLLSLFLALRPDDGADEPSGTPTVATTTADTIPPAPTAPPPVPRKPPPVPLLIEVVGGAPRGGIQRAAVARGKQVRLFVQADVTDHVHLHGYDLTADVAPGKPATIVFRATVPGRFEIELEESGVQLAELEVRP